MVNPGAFLGSRKEFLLGEKASYSEGVQNGFAADALGRIQRRYFKRYPVDLPHNEEPSVDFTDSMDDNAPDPDRVEPNQTNLTEEVYAVAMAAVVVRRQTVTMRKACDIQQQIKRWLSYQYMKDHDIDAKESGINNPYRVLLHQLTGVAIQRPRLISSTNVWRKTQRPLIEEEVRRRVLVDGTPRSGLAALRDRIAREMFIALSHEERHEWGEQAKENHEANIAAWKLAMESPPSTDAADRQRCIQGLVRFAQPFLDLLSQATGWKTTLIAGGPEPAHEGRLNVISLHSGTTSGDVKMTFGRSERAFYKKQFLPAYGVFLKKCYSPEECRAHALTADEGFESLLTMDLEADGAACDAIPEQEAIPSLSTASSTTTLTANTPLQTNSPSPPPSRVMTPVVSPIASLRGSPSPPPSHHPTPHNSPVAVLATLQPTDAPPVDAPPVDSPHVDAPPVDSLPVDAPPVDVLPVNAPPVDVLPVNVPHAVDELHVDAPPVDEPLILSLDADPLPSHSSKRLRSRSSVTTSLPTDVPHQNKRLRISLSPPVISVPSETDSAAQPFGIPPNSPNWFSAAIAMIRNDDFGPQWTRLVAAWAQFEVRENFQGTVNLKARGRPVLVKDWIQRARSSTWRPDITNLLQLETDFLSWWTSLQPAWRISEESGLLRDTVEGDWGVLRRAGVNGLLSVVAALFFWGEYVVDMEIEKKDWLLMVDDCLTAFTHLEDSVA